MADVSIVIIGRNEELHIAKCVWAAQRAAVRAGGAEIIFVDSASTDSTAAIAAGMGVRVISLPADSKLCPSAGRHAGARSAAGEFILFIDADTLINEDFLDHAIAHLNACPDVAGVNGRIDDLDENGVLLDDVEERYDSTADVKWLRGPACLYRRRALLDVGSFDPQIAMEEEAELGLRLVKAGWRLNVIPVAMACHTRCYHCQSLASLVATFRRDLVSGRLGEITRTIAAAATSGNAIAFCWLRLKTTILLLGWFALLPATLLLPSPIALPAFALVAILGLLSVYLKKRSIRQTLLFIPNKLFIVIDVLAGLPKLVRPRAGRVLAADRR